MTQTVIGLAWAMGAFMVWGQVVIGLIYTTIFTYIAKDTDDITVSSVSLAYAWFFALIGQKYFL